MVSPTYTLNTVSYVPDTFILIYGKSHPRSWKSMNLIWRDGEYKRACEGTGEKESAWIRNTGA